MRFSQMMIRQGFEVYHYGVETSESNATVQVDVLSLEEWDQLRVESLCYLKHITEDEAKRHLNNPTSFVGDLANWSTPLYKRFNERFRQALLQHFRDITTDIVCLPFGRSHNDALTGLNMLTVETGIGYPDSFSDCRIFESYAHLHTQLATEHKKHCPLYWFVIPNYYNVDEWTLCSDFPAVPRIGFLGRICDIKGWNILADVAKCFPHVEFVVCGQHGQDKEKEKEKETEKKENIRFLPPISGIERSHFLGNLNALIAPSLYVEPFCGVNVEAQLCGTPVICTDFGAFAETVEQFKTGVRCHTLADFCVAVHMALDHKFDRRYIHTRARTLYGTDAVGPLYKHALMSMLDLTKDGWYTNVSHMTSP